jgi:hypothetical protein
MGTAVSGSKQPDGVLEDQYTACLLDGYRQAVHSFDGGIPSQVGKLPTLEVPAEGFRRGEQVRASVRTKAQRTNSRAIGQHRQFHLDTLPARMCNPAARY